MEYRKGFINQGISFVLGLVVIGIVLGAGLLALGGFATGQSGATLNALNNATSGLTNISTQMPTIGILSGVALLLIVLFAAVGPMLGRR